MKIIFLICISLAAVAKEIKSVPGEYVVKLKNDKSSFTSFAKIVKSTEGIEIKSSIPSLSVVVIKATSNKSASRVLAADPNVIRVEPNFIYSIDYSFGVRSNDPSLSKLWGMINTGQPDSAGQAGTPGVDVNAIQAWKVQTGSKDVVVAVIDTGVNYKHKDLAPNMWMNDAEKNGKKGVDDDNNGYVDDIYGWNFVKNSADPMDDQGHGSHCSGTIGAKGNDRYGIVGVAWNTRIMALKFLDANGSGTLENALKAIDYATKNGAKVLSNSWGGGGFSETLRESIVRSHEAGTVFVAAAGNDSNDNDVNESYPASYDVPNIISVAAIDNQGKLANFSNYGKNKVHIGAPGVNIYSSIVKGYDSWSGTSMATPHVAGAAVLVASQYPGISGVEIKDAIVKSARPSKSLRGKTVSGGTLDANGAVLKLVTGPDLDDPMNWTQKMDYQLSTEHPYKSELKNEWEISVPGASEISVYFEKFDTEFRFDNVSLYDSNGKLVQVLSGTQNDTYSEVIKGNYVKIVFETDKSLEKYGFDISKIMFR